MIHHRFAMLLILEEIRLSPNPCFVCECALYHACFIHKGKQSERKPSTLRTCCPFASNILRRVPIPMFALLWVAHGHRKTNNLPYLDNARAITRLDGEQNLSRSFDVGPKDGGVVVSKCVECQYVDHDEDL